MARKDNVTVELPGLPPRRGRPATGKAKSGAERQRAYRKKLREAQVSGVQISPGSGWRSEKEYEELRRMMNFSRNSMFKMEQNILAYQKEIALLVEERRKLFAEVERLQAELARRGK